MTGGRGLGWSCPSTGAPGPGPGPVPARCRPRSRPGRRRAPRRSAPVGPCRRPYPVPRAGPAARPRRIRRGRRDQLGDAGEWIDGDGPATGLESAWRGRDRAGRDSAGRHRPGRRRRRPVRALPPRRAVRGRPPPRRARSSETSAIPPDTPTGRRPGAGRRRRQAGVLGAQHQAVRVVEPQPPVHERPGERVGERVGGGRLDPEVAGHDLLGGVERPGRGDVGPDPVGVDQADHVGQRDPASEQERIRPRAPVGWRRTRPGPVRAGVRPGSA